MIPRQPPIPERPAVLILHAVKEHERLIGIGMLALLLKGSHDKRIFSRRLHESRFFGALFYHPVDVLQNFIKELLAMGFLTAIDIGSAYPMPVLQLTPAGSYALENRTEISLPTERTYKPLVLNETTRATIELFRQLRNIPAVAQQRTLAESTIWMHLTTAVKLGLLTPEEIVDEKVIRLIRTARDKLKPKGLKELKAALPESISYEEIRCVTAAQEGASTSEPRDVQDM